MNLDSYKFETVDFRKIRGGNRYDGMGRIFYSIFRDWSNCTVRGGCISHSMRDQVSEEKIVIHKKADPVWRFWNGEKSAACWN